MKVSTSPQPILESLIESYGLPYILQALSSVCSEKAAHVYENYQDTDLADAWDLASEELETLAEKFKYL